MKSTELKLTRIGNSRGIRLPADTLRRYGIESGVLMEEKTEGILLRPLPVEGEKQSWEKTAREIASAEEDWAGWDSSAPDGLENLPWQADEAADINPGYGTDSDR
jgi:antitoxin component of MazEF toxin-antitoxin module